MSQGTTGRNRIAGVSPAVSDQTERPVPPRPEHAPGEDIATLGLVSADTAAALAAAGLDEPRRRARRLIAAALGISETEVFADPKRQLGPAERGQIAAVLERVLRREPLTRILGRREFWGLELSLSPDTLDPRPETETVVEAVLARRPDRRPPYRILDLGTGSGCLLLALLSEFAYANGIGIDIARGAVMAARGNAAVLGLADRARFVISDWAKALAGRFDIVVANPPYIETAAIPDLAPEVRDHDPHLALDGGGDGLAGYRKIVSELPRLLAPGGLFATEIGSDQADAVAALLRQAGLTVEAVVPDLAGLPRCVVARP